MGAGGSVAASNSDHGAETSSKLEDSKALVEQFRDAVMKAASDIQFPAREGSFSGKFSDKEKPPSAKTEEKTLKSVFDQFDLNHDGVLDRSELDLLIQRLNFDVSDQLKAGLRANMKSLLLELGDDSFHIVFSEFAEVLKPEASTSIVRQIVSKEPKRIVFVGATGSGKSSLCTALTGQSKAATNFKIGNKASSETSACRVDRYPWFGENNEEHFVCVDTPGLDDEFGRDNEHVNQIIEEMKQLEYVNGIVMVVNGQNPRFSTSLQLMIQKFEQAFTAKFYDHSMIVMTRWYMDEDSVVEREEDGRSEEKVTEELNQKISSSDRLGCRKSLPVVFVDCFYQRKDPKNGQKRLAKIRELVTNNVFRTADLATVKPKICEITNLKQEIRTKRSISLIQPILFDESVQVLQWMVTPVLPIGLVLDPVKGVISGTPLKTLVATTFELTARSVGGWSDPFPFELEIGHSENEVKRLVLQSMKSITLALEDLLPLDSTEPYDDSELRAKITKTQAIGSDLFKEKLNEMKKLYGSLFTFPEFVDRFRAEYDRTEILLENEFLQSNQKAMDTVREKEKIENDLQLQLLRETTNVFQFKTLLHSAEMMGTIEPELLEKAKKWLQDITPTECCYSRSGCCVRLRKKERQQHENFCIFGLPTFSKEAMETRYAPDSKTGVVLKSTNPTTTKDTVRQALGKYGFDEDDHEYFYINSSAQRLFRIRPEPKGSRAKSKRKIDLPVPPVTWVVTSSSSLDGPDTILATSKNQCIDVLQAEFEDCLVEAPVSFHWKEDKKETRPVGDSLLLMYFGGKWCPFCP
jgi:predicted GTPase